MLTHKKTVFPGFSFDGSAKILDSPSSFISKKKKIEGLTGKNLSCLQTDNWESTQSTISDKLYE